MNEKIIVHARVTRAVEVTAEEAAKLAEWASPDGGVPESEIAPLLERFTEGADSGGYEPGYIPGAWLEADLSAAGLRRSGECGLCDIDL